MPEYRVSIDLTGLHSLADLVIANVIPGVQAAVEQTANETQATWQAAIMHAPGVWLGFKKAAAESIRWVDTSPLSAEVFSPEDVTRRIEEGFPARDLKDMLKTSTRTRQTKSGKKYLIIPFRHNTPGQNAHALAMPSDIYAQAKPLSPSAVSGKTTRVSATGHSVPQSIYQWGGRLPAGLAPKMKPHHATDIYAGMVRFDTSSGASKSSAYLTFRVMHDGQAGKWLVPAKPGLHIARDVSRAMVERLRQNVEANIAVALS